MKSKILYQQMILKEQEHKVNFLTFSLTDFKTAQFRPITLSKLEPLYKSAIEISFTRTLENNNQLKFITIAFIETLSRHPNKTLSEMIKNLIGRKIRLYEGIFPSMYFDFEDQCFANNIVKVESKTK